MVNIFEVGEGVTSEDVKEIMGEVRKGYSDHLKLIIMTDSNKEDTLLVLRNVYTIPLGEHQPLALLGKIIMSFGHHLSDKHLEIYELPPLDDRLFPFDNPERFPPGCEVCSACGGYWNDIKCQECIQGVNYGS